MEAVKRDWAQVKREVNSKSKRRHPKRLYAVEGVRTCQETLKIYSNEALGEREN